MIHHYSIPVSDTKHVAGVIAKLLRGKITSFGPYKNSYIVWAGDEYGTAIEFFPSGTELTPGEGSSQATFIHNSTNSGYTSTHAAISIDRTREEIHGFAEELGWRSIELSRGGFNVIEFWIENKVMIEFLTGDMAKDYLATTDKFRPEKT